MFKITKDTPVRTTSDGIVIVSGPGGSPWVTDPERSHLGGNFDGGDLGTMYQKDLWPWLIEMFSVKTMADVGCGTGETTGWFRGQGIKSVGVDGLPWNVAQAKRRAGDPIILHDFTKDGICKFDDVDLIWCSDVVEHIAEEYVDNILQTLRQATTLALCQGTEAHGDVGWNHVNNQPESYWIEKLASIGMIEDEAMTVKAREIGNHGWWIETGRIYRRK